MSTPTVGFYIHHDGRGHLDRTRLIIENLGAERSVVATSAPDAREVLGGVRCTVLPNDVPPGSVCHFGDVTANGALHWAPERPDTAIRRLRSLVDWVAETMPSVVVVDVSVEAAVQIRLLGVPVVVVRLPGRRTDPAHRLAHQVAEALLAPFPETFEGDGDVDDDVRRRTTYCGHIGPKPHGGGGGPHDHEGPCRVLVVWGRGTPPPSPAELDAAAASTPGWVWALAGPPDTGPPPKHVEQLGWREDLLGLAAASCVVVGSTGDGTIGLVAATRAGYVALPQRRPFDEQMVAAHHLERLGLAVVEPSWPAAERWPCVLAAARQVRPDRRAVLGADGAADRAAELIDRTARRLASR